MAAFMRHMHTVVAKQSPKFVRSYTSMVCFSRRHAKSFNAPKQLNYVRNITVRATTHSSFPQWNHGEEDVVKAAEHVRKSINMLPGLPESQVQNFRHLVENTGHVSQEVAMTLLSCFGSCLYNVAPRQRTKLLQETWHMLQQNCVLEVGHYNSLLKAYVQNGHNFTPTDIITEMQSRHIMPDMLHYPAPLFVDAHETLKAFSMQTLVICRDHMCCWLRDTYENLMEHYCNHGNIQAANTVIDIMKECGHPIREKVYSFLMTGFFRSGDAESARGVMEEMQEASVIPSQQSYTALLCGYAQLGDMAAVKQLISEAPDAMVNSRSVMEALVAMAVAGHTQHVEEMIKLREAVTNSDADGLIYVSQLLALGLDKFACKLFSSLHKHEKDPNHARLLLEMFTQFERPLDSVMELMGQLKGDNLSVGDISDVVSAAFRMGKTDYAVSAIELMKSMSEIKEEGARIQLFALDTNIKNLFDISRELFLLTKTINLPVQTHYFWPAFCQYRDKGDKQGIISTTDKMVKLCDSRHDQLQTYLTYIYPALQKLGHPQDEMLTLPLHAGFQAEDVNFVNVTWIFDSEGPEAAWNYAKDKKVHGNVKLFKRISSGLGHLGNVDSSWDCLFKIILHCFQGNSLEKVTGHVLQEISQVKPTQEIRGRVLGFVTENNMVFTEEEQNKLGVVLKDASAPVSETLQHMEERGSEQGHTPSFSVLKEQGYHYATRSRDLDAALRSIRRIEVMYPEKGDYHSLVLAVAHLLLEEGLQAEALVQLGNYSDKWKHLLLQTRNNRMRADCSRLVRSVSTAADGAQLVESLVYYGYLDTAHSVLNTYMEALLYRKDLHEVTEGVLYTASKYRWIPKLNDVILWLITTQEAQTLQTVVDAATGLLGQQEVVMRLVEGFLRSGQNQRVTQLLKKDDVLLGSHWIKKLVQKLVKGLRVTELEGFVEAVRGIENIDRRILMSELIRCYGNLHDEEAALAVWERCQEEGVTLEPASLNILNNYLQAVNIPAPFPVPPAPSKPRFEDVADDYLYHCIMNKQWENITESLTSLTQAMFFKLVDKVPRGERAIQATQRIAFHLGEAGNIDTLRAINNSRAVPGAAVENVRRALFCAYIHRDRHDELVWHLKQRTDILASYLSSHGLSLLKEKSQYHYGEVVSMIHRLAMLGQLKAAGMLWVHYFIGSSSEADQLLQMYQGLDADLPLGFVFSHIRTTNKVELIPRLVDTLRSRHKQLVKTYDHCLSYYYSNRDLDAMMTVGRQLQEDGIRPTQLTKKYIRYVNYHCLKNNIASPFDTNPTEPNNCTKQQTDSVENLSSVWNRDGDMR